MSAEVFTGIIPSSILTALACTVSGTSIYCSCVTLMGTDGYCAVVDYDTVQCHLSVLRILFALSPWPSFWILLCCSVSVGVCT